MAVDLGAIVEAEVDSEIPHGSVLSAFASALVDGDAQALADAREKLRAAMGDEAVVDAAGVASNFQRMVRIADGTGIPLGESLETRSADVRTELQIERFKKRDRID